MIVIVHWIVTEAWPTMRQKITVADHQVLVTLSGSIYVEDAVRLRERLLDLMANGCNTLIIDLKGADFIDSAGLGALVAIHKRARENGGSVIVQGLNGFVKELFVLVRLDKVFDIQ